jgi:hypothetical protein
MARFGQDFQTLWRKLEGYWTTLYLLMERNSAHLRMPPDPRDPNHKVTKVILDQLKELTSQFEFCENLIAAQLSKRGAVNLGIALIKLSQNILELTLLSSDPVQVQAINRKFLERILVYQQRMERPPAPHPVFVQALLKTRSKRRRSSGKPLQATGEKGRQGMRRKWLRQCQMEELETSRIGAAEANLQ